MKNPDLPRRQLESKTVKGVTMAGQKRKRRDQLSNLVPAEDAEDAAELEAVTQEAALSRRGKGYENLCKTWQQNSKMHLAECSGVF